MRVHGGASCLGTRGSIRTIPMPDVALQLSAIRSTYHLEFALSMWTRILDMSASCGSFALACSVPHGAAGDKENTREKSLLRSDVCAVNYRHIPEAREFGGVDSRTQRKP